MILCWFVALGLLLPSFHLAGAAPIAPDTHGTSFAAPGNFGKSSPGNGASNQPNWTLLSWGAAGGAIEYGFCIVAGLTQACPNQDAGYTRISGTSTYVLLEPNTTYSWQVRAYDGIGGITPADGSGGWWQLSTGPAPGGFSKSGPSSGSTNQPNWLLISWGSSSSATGYGYCFSTTGPACPNQDAGYARVNGNSTYVALQPNTTYYWQVRAYNSIGSYTPADGSGGWWTLTTGPAPGNFAKVGPSNGGTSGNPTRATLTWQAASGATDYGICISTIALTCPNQDAGYQRVGNVTNWTSPNNLTPNTTYWWQVRAYNSIGSYTPADGAGTWYTFVTPASGSAPGAFSKVAPANGTVNAGRPVTLTWGTASGATEYRYCIVAGTAPACPGSDAGYSTNGGGTSVTLTNLQPSTTYTWQARAYDSSGTITPADGVGGWWVFTTAGQVTSPPPPIQPPMPDGYDVNQLPTLGGTGSTANGINNSGQVFGSSQTTAGNTHAFLAPPPNVVGTGPRDLGTLGGPNSVAFGANVLGQVVGQSQLPNGAPTAFVFKDGRMDQLPGVANFASSAATAINDAGDIIGTGDNRAFAIRAIDQQLIDLNAIGGFSTSQAVAINSSGQVGGQATAAGGQPTAFVYDGNQFITMPPLAAFAQSMVNDLNDTGLVVGEADGRGFLLNLLQGSLIDFNSRGGFATSTAVGINNAGQILGVGDNQPFLYDAKTDNLRLLSDLVGPAISSMGLLASMLETGITIDALGGINDSALVAVTGVVNGESRALLLDVRAGQVLLDIAQPSGGQVATNPGGTTFTAGTVVTLTATPDPGNIFLGWTIDRQQVGWDPTLTLTMGGSHTVAAAFAARPAFPDVNPSTTGATEAIAQLAARNVIRGYEDGTFGPTDPVLRAQMAALIARAVGWDAEAYGSPFDDQGTVDENLWRNVGTLAHYNVAKGYGDGTYNPTGEVLYAQVISFVTRAMVAKGYWQFQGDNAAIYPNVPADSGHRVDLTTYVYYAGPVRGTTSGTEELIGWDQPSSRALFAFALWQALDGYFATERVP